MSSSSSFCSSSSIPVTPICCPTMENTLRSVALLNTKGIHALVMGRKNHVPRALQSFKKALAEIERLRASDYQQTHCCCASGQRCSARFTGEEENYLEAFNSSPVARLEAQQSADSFYVYNRAVFFKPLSDTSSIGFTFYTAILQFNMALAHHTKASTSTDNTTTTTTSASSDNNKSLHRSLKYYKLCLKTLREVGVCGSMADRPPYPGGGESMIYLRLAALNNLAHVHSIAGDYRKVDETLARVFKFTVAQRPTLFLAQQRQSNNMDDDCSGRSSLVIDRALTSMNSNFVNEVLLNVMVSGPVAGAGAA